MRSILFLVTVFSLKKRRPFVSTPIVIYGLIALNFAIYLYEASLDSSALQQFLDLWAMVPKQLTLELAGSRLSAAPEWPTLLTFQFLHAGWFHLAGNLVCLWLFGHRIEAHWGHVVFLSFYVLCGGLAGLSQWMVEPSSLLPTLGASGAVAGIMGAYVVRFPQAKVALFFVGLWFVQQVFYVALSWDSTGLSNIGLGDTVDMTPVNIAYAAHAGGFIVGVTFSWVTNFLAESRQHYVK